MEFGAGVWARAGRGAHRDPREAVRPSVRPRSWARCARPHSPSAVRRRLCLQGTPLPCKVPGMAAARAQVQLSAWPPDGRGPAEGSVRVLRRLRPREKSPRPTQTPAPASGCRRVPVQRSLALTPPARRSLCSHGLRPGTALGTFRTRLRAQRLSRVPAAGLTGASQGRLVGTLRKSAPVRVLRRAANSQSEGRGAGPQHSFARGRRQEADMLQAPT